MAQVQELKVETRDGTGKGPAYQARLKGLIPAIVYGGTATPQNVSVDSRTLERHVEAGHFLTTLFLLDIAGKKTRVIPRDVQLDPVSDRPVHVDFLRLAEGATVKLDIPVHFRGQDVSPGLKKGGVLNIVRHTMPLSCPAEKIPNTIDVDVSKLVTAPYASEPAVAHSRWATSRCTITSIRSTAGTKSNRSHTNGVATL